MLGGSSSVSEYRFSLVHFRGVSNESTDYMVYTRGSKDDFDRYARYSGDDGWSWDSMRKFFERVSPFLLLAIIHT